MVDILAYRHMPFSTELAANVDILKTIYNDASDIKTRSFTFISLLLLHLYSPCCPAILSLAPFSTLSWSLYHSTCPSCSSSYRCCYGS